MDFLRKLTLGAGLAALALAGAQAQIVAPQVQTVGPNDLFQDIPNGYPQANSYYVSGANLSGSLAANGMGTNWLIGGKADQNLWQRASTGSSVTTTVTYGGPDRWAYWSGTSTAMTVSKVSTAAALPSGSANVFRMQRTASQTGVVQMCAMQEISTLNTYYLQGHTVEADLNVYTGANFSSATGINVYISYGTGTDEGVSLMAFSLNGGGGGSAATGFANATAGAIAGVNTVSTAYRVAAVGTIPTTATEMSVSVCYTPVGTASTTDALYFDNVDLRKADGLASFANATTGYVLNNNVMTAVLSGITQNATIPPISLRLYGDEQRNQLAYYYELDETATIWPVAACASSDTTHAQCNLQFPVPMRAVPTAAFSNGFAVPTSTTQATLGACTTLAASTVVSSTVLSKTNAMLQCTAGTVPAAGVAENLYSNNGTGKIKISAEL